MSRYALIPSHSLLVLLTALFGFASPAAAAAQPRASESYGKLPLHFEANQGQTHEDVRFLSRGPGYSLYLTAGEAVLVLTRPGPDENRKRNAQASPSPRAQGESVALRMSLVGAARKPLVSGLGELPGKANYFIGKDQSKWRTNVPTYAKVHYREVYPGIDLVYYGNQRQLEYDFVVAPGADPKKIVLGFKGAEWLEIDVRGELVLHTAGGDIRQHKPIIYQDIDGVRQEIAGGYVFRSGKQVGFQVAAYDRSRPLVIDPVLSYSTYLGGSTNGSCCGGNDEGSSIAVDANGSAYVTGATNSTNFPTTSGAFQTTGGGSDAFVTKLDPTGSALVYSTYLGGSRDDGGSGIAVDADGNAYVTGSTSSNNFPTTSGAFQSIYNGGDAFVTKLDPTGSVLVYSTYLGGGANDQGADIAVDADRNAYVTGVTWNRCISFSCAPPPDFPTTAGAFQTTLRGTSDAFVTKLNPAGSALLYSTYLGGSANELGFGIAVDAEGNAYVTGSTPSTDFPTTTGAFQPTSGSGTDAFVTKLDPTGSGLVYSTFLGGSNHELGLGIAVDAGGNAYVTGYTQSTDFPTVNAIQQAFGGFWSDAFVTKLNPAGSALVYSTYLGGSSTDQGFGIAVDVNGNAYVTGYTASTDFPTAPLEGALQPTSGGGTDVFVTKLDPTGSVPVYSTYLGGSGEDGGFGIAVDAEGNAYVTGNTKSTNFPTTSGSFQPSFAGGDPNGIGRDAFVAKFSFPTRFEEDAATYSGFWTSYGAEIGAFSGGSIVASNQTTASATFSFTGTAVSWIGVKCNVCGIAMVSIDGGAPTPVDTFGHAAPGSLTSEPVFSASGLAPDVTHTLAITVTGATTSLLNLLPGSGHVAVDAFDVTR